MEKIKIKFSFFLLTIISVFVTSCGSDDNGGSNQNTSLPQITTNPVQNIGSNYAKFGGNITDNGGSEIYQRGVCWSTSINPVRYNDHYQEDGSNQLGSFSFDVENLLPNTTYYVRAYCENEVGIQYGSSVSFTTTSLVTTLNATDILTRTVVLKGNVNQPPSEGRWVGFVYATTPNPTFNNQWERTLIYGSDNYQIEITGLTENTIYYYRSYTEENGAYIYGEQKQFRTTGYTGVAGGYIAYDMGEDNNGWRYLEVHPERLYYNSFYDGAFWGESTFIGGLSDHLGAGLENTQIISNNVSSANCAAKLCNNLVRNGYSDWFLPSKIEGEFIGKSLAHLNALSLFWTSSQVNQNSAYSVHQNNTYTNSKSSDLYVYPVRRY